MTVVENISVDLQTYARPTIEKAGAIAEEPSCSINYVGSGIRSLPARYRTFLRQTVYVSVKDDVQIYDSHCARCQCVTPITVTNRDLESRIRENLNKKGGVMGDHLSPQIMTVVNRLYDDQAEMIRAKILVRGSKCRRCRSEMRPVRRDPPMKRVHFESSSLFADRSEAFPELARNQDGDLYQCVYEVHDNYDFTSLGKRVIGSVNGMEAVSTGYIDFARLIDAQVLKRIGRENESLGPCDKSLNGVTGHKIGMQVVDRLDVDAILGTDTLKAFRAVIDLDDNTLNLKTTNEVFQLGSPTAEEFHLSRVSSTIRLQPGGQAIVVIDLMREVSEGTTVLVEGLPELDLTTLVARTLCSVQSGKLLVEMCNSSTENAMIRKGTSVAMATIIPDSVFAYEQKSLDKDNPGLAYDEYRKADEVISSTMDKTLPMDPIPDLVKVMKEELDVDYTGMKLNTEQQQLLKDLLEQFRDMFVETSMTPGRTELLKFSIDTGSSPPIKQRPYRVFKAEGDVMEAGLQPYLDLGHIRPSTSPWASPVLMICKPDGGIRFCIDYRRFNGVTVKDCYPMPLIDDILDVLGNARLFSIMDIASGYWNVPMPEIAPKNAFTCKYGLYEWLVMPFGLWNVVPAFEHLIFKVENLFGLCVIFSDDFPTHLVWLIQVLGRFQSAGFKLKMKKCKWGRDQVASWVTSSHILPNPEKVKPVINVRRPHDLHTVRAFLGLASYFRRYIPGYAGIPAPIERLKIKGAARRLIEPPIFVYLDSSKRFKLYVDSSRLAVGTCLMQTVDGRDRVVAYASK
ncbi:hypothetical protein PHMEG_0008799 [Phytophthora megakarya]|uniref:Uncharacterized protein n=1 Tax=Phytophthora megakarya TaxID=4795 RepID=A0A225WJH5_9STRA|nr:hypothetical protein PHMEG_0008799 [Phytophthora megakarya]